MLVLEAKKYLNHYDRDLSIQKFKEYQVEEDYTSFGIERYQRKLPTEENNLIPNKKEDINHVKPQVKRKNLAVKKWVSLKSALTDNAASSIAFRTRSASKVADVELQTKRRRKEAKVVPPQKKPKIENTKNKPAKTETKKALKLSKMKSADIGSEVEKIIHLQNTDGFWDLSTNLSEMVNSMLGHDLDISTLSKKSITALIVALFKEKCEDYKYLWDLVVEKAKRWLRRNKQKLIKLSIFELVLTLKE
ncbi:unnamed protein product [Blepharisma stoltei]|uniref:Uncharacterized protein n=1 Tax=Blepharisma stoltei TaxID=1481888 RepID=A0AAU9I7S5_9CILI|nr:unnamed protein product [Blepharisma stoltei]